MEILQAHLPDDMQRSRALPGIAPVQGPWLRVDEAYAAQMRHRLELLQTKRSAVFHCGDSAEPAAQELMDLVLHDLPSFGYEVSADGITCPDGRHVARDGAGALEVLSRTLQCDICLLDRVGDEHVLHAATLCFPASWTLSEKIGRPLGEIHMPVAEYDETMRRRVQRLFDAVRAGQPLWRFNRLWYADPELFQPRSEQAPRSADLPAGSMEYLRAERQTILRLPKTNWCVFAIHTYVVLAENAG